SPLLRRLLLAALRLRGSSLAPPPSSPPLATPPSAALALSSSSVRRRAVQPSTARRRLFDHLRAPNARLNWVCLNGGCASPAVSGPAFNIVRQSRVGQDHCRRGPFRGT